VPQETLRRFKALWFMEHAFLIIAARSASNARESLRR